MVYNESNQSQSLSPPNIPQSDSPYFNHLAPTITSLSNTSINNASHSTLHINIDTVETKPYYKIAKTRNRYPLCGYCGCISGPCEDLPANICLWLIFIIPTIAFGIFVGPTIYKLTIFLPIAYGLLFSITLLLLLATQCSDPGFIPMQPPPTRFRTPVYRRQLQMAYTQPQTQPQDAGFGGDVSPNTTEQTHVLQPDQQQYHDPNAAILKPNEYVNNNPSNQSISSKEGNLDERGSNPPSLEEDRRPILPVEVTVNIQGKQLTFKYCPTCHIYRPPLTSHCSSCNACCKESDHHCPVLNNCIAQRNYSFFISFNVFIMAHIICTLVGTGVFLSNSGSSDHHSGDLFNKDYLMYICLGIIAVVGIVGLILVGSLCGFHVFLWCCKGESTTKNLLLSKKKRQQQQQHETYNPNQLHLNADTTLVDDNDDYLADLYPLHNQYDHCATPEQYVVEFIKDHMYLLQDNNGDYIKTRTYCFRRPISLLSLRRKLPVDYYDHVVDNYQY